MADAKKYFDLVGLTEYWSKYKTFIDSTTDAIDSDTLEDILGAAKLSKVLKTVEFEDLIPVEETGDPFIVEYDDTYVRYEVINLSITADDVSGRKSTTTIHYTATRDFINTDTSTPDTSKTITETGTATSEDFGVNPSETETRTITISYTYDGKTATTTITQGVYISTVEADYILVNDSTCAEELGWNNSWSVAQGWSVDTDNNPDTSKYALYSTDFSNFGKEGTIYSNSDWEATTDPSEAIEFDNVIYAKITGVTEFTFYTSFINYINDSDMYGNCYLVDSSGSGDDLTYSWDTCEDIDDIFNSSNDNSYKVIASDLDPSSTYYFYSYMGISNNDGVLSEISNFESTSLKILVPISLSSNDETENEEEQEGDQ